MARRRADYAANRDAERARSLAHYHKNKHRHAEGRRGQPGRRERYNGYQAAYVARHKERLRPMFAAQLHTRRARLRGGGGKVTGAEIQALYGRQKGRCPACRRALKKRYHVDHVRPLARGGANTIRNIQLLCPPCNQTKHAKDPIAWARERGLLL